MAGSGIGSEIGTASSVIHGAWKTEPTDHYRCLPTSKFNAEITWEPVILPLLERLAELRWLPKDRRWPGAEWPTVQAFQDAVSFAERLPVPMRVRPHIALADDGEVNFSW